MRVATPVRLFRVGLSAPAPLGSIPLVYEHAFGGAGVGAHRARRVGTHREAVFRAFGHAGTEHAVHGAGTALGAISGTGSDS